MEIMLECPNCTNLVCVDFDDSAEDSYHDFVCPKCGHDKTSLRHVLKSHFENIQREYSDYVIQQGELTEYNGHSSRVDLPASVTFIKGGERPENNAYSYRSFYDESDIVRGCFEGNAHLKEFYSTTSLLVIGAYAFANCKNLRKVALCEGLVSISYGAFEGCDSLEEIQIPITCTHISPGVFRNCKNLKRVRFMCTPSDYNWSSFWLGYGHHENGLSRTDAWGYYNPDVPDRTDSMWFCRELFHGCSSLSQVNIPKCVKRIPTNCFSLCTSLRYIDLSDNEMLSTISDNAFYGCTSLESVKLPSHLEEYPWVTDPAYKRSLKIYDGAFYGCISLESINIPDFVEFGYSSEPFDGCRKLNVTISNEKMLEDYRHFYGSGPDGNGLNERCLYASTEKYDRLRRIKWDLQDIVADRRYLQAQRNRAGFFEFDLKSRLDRKISELSTKERSLAEEGRRLDKEAESELRSLCSKYGVDFYERFCDSTDSWGSSRWQSFDEWWRKELY